MTRRGKVAVLAAIDTSVLYSVKRPLTTAPVGLTRRRLGGRKDAYPVLHLHVCQYLTCTQKVGKCNTCAAN